MRVKQMRRKALSSVCAVAMTVFPCATARAQSPAITPPTSDYWVYVGAESADLIHRLRFGPGGNFNLHGDMVPSSISVEHTPSFTDVARIVTCTMPHGSRLDPSGLFHYHGCMMDDPLVEIDARRFVVSRRFSLAKGKEGPLPADGGEPR
jgi:hypothetical protein